MLAFFRKYQRYFFLLVTVVIVISFSFFGTYNTLGADSLREAVAFKAVDGTAISRLELEEMATFIGTDINDSKLYGGAWGPNFLNDGVISKDFLATGLGEILMLAYVPDFKNDWDLRLRKEKGYVPYSNPNAKFISASSAWSYFAPDMMKELVTIQRSNNPTDPDLLHAKVMLYLNQLKFSPRLLMQVLSYQQNQYQQFVPADPNLLHTDLFLFGYHTLDDWFGQRFVRLISQFIINASKIATQRGYFVSKEEALADLLWRSEQSFRDNVNNPHIGVKNSSDYFQEQLRRMGMDQTHAVKIWQEVLLFRRLFHDFGNSVFTDLLMYQQFNQYALQMVGGSLYELPQELRLAKFSDLQKLETYLSSVSKRGTDSKALLDLPTTYLSPEEVSKRHPELVQKKYKLEVAQIDKNSLESRVGLKETWEWETSNENWKTLRDKFPELGMKKGETPEERLSALDELDFMNRAKADQFARSQIVEAHPEWITEALESAPRKTETVGLRAKGSGFPFQGIEDREAFIKLLDQAPLNDQDPKLTNVKAGDKGYYQIRVLERSPNREILTFAEARANGTLDEVVDQALEVNYVKMRGNNPDKFQNADKSWRPLADVRTEVGADQFKAILEAIKKDYLSVNNDANKEQLTEDKLASLRFYKPLRDTLTALQKDPSTEKNLVRQEGDEIRSDLKDQWKLVKGDAELTRGKDNGALDVNALLALKPNSWSGIHTPVNGDLNFFYVTKEGVQQDPEALDEQTRRARWILSNDAQQRLMLQLLQMIHAKNAISFDYLTPSQPTMESEM